MSKVYVDIKSCKNCPMFTIGRTWSSDGFDRMEDWVCTGGAEEKIIQKNVEWHEERKITIPEWCPRSTQQPTHEENCKIMSQLVTEIGLWHLAQELYDSHPLMTKPSDISEFAVKLVNKYNVTLK